MCRIGIAGYCIFLLCSVSAAAPGTDVPTIKNFAKFEEFAEKVMQIRIQSISVGNEQSSTIPCGTIRVTVNKGMGDEKCDFTLGEKDGFVYSAFHSLEYSEDSTRKASDAVSKERAFEAVKRVIKYYNLAFRAEDFRGGLANMGRMADPNDNLEDCWWEFIRSPLYWNNWPCRGTRLSVHVSAASGILVSVIYEPVILPRGPEPTQDIGPAAAIERAKEWLKRPIFYLSGKNPRLQPEVGKQVKKVIALPFSMFESNPTAPMPCFEESFYCWEVPFVYTEHDHVFDGVIWIDMSTGAFIGSGEVR